MALLGISPPPAFLQNPGAPTIPLESWIRMFENYVLALADDMEDKRKRALLIHTVGTEAQRIFYTLPDTGDSYAAALQALKTFFIPKLNTVAERNKFRQRAQRVGESTAQYAAALRELVTTCDFGALADDMIRDQIVEKTNNRRIRERLLMEDNLTLQKTLTMSAQIESALAEAKAMATPAGEAVVGMVQGSSTGGGRYRHGHGRPSSKAPPASSQRVPTNGPGFAGKTCYRCGSSTHIASFPKWPAKAATCRKCSKHGHFERVCRSGTVLNKMREVSIEQTDTVKILQVEEEDVTSLNNRLMCKVSMCAPEGPTITVDLLVDTGSAVSILPMHLYQKHYGHIPLSTAKKRLVTYSGQPISVLGCLELTVTCGSSCATVIVYVVSSGNPLLGLDLFNALNLFIKDGQVSAPVLSPTAPPALQHPSAFVQYTAPTTNLEVLQEISDQLGLVTGFAHKVKVRPEVRPVQQVTPSAVCCA
ncbi:uncharacterized protein LOC112144321 [Oryzias melastigma]|uniref:uncharacterized protein LOC112144321 n=1 Tax=Oryzias melastigma TaxID=30732 RepID=UPI000CF82A81|nr:uncharacterized protein LOC112144321 [Oryzias melastigma]